MRFVGYLVLALTLICYGVMLYAEFEHVRLFSGGLASPDFRFLGYSIAELSAWRDAIGSNGSKLFIKWLPHGLDAVFPALLGASLCFVFYQVLSKFERYSAMDRFTKFLVPLFFVLPYVALDYFENKLIVDFLNSGAASDENLAVLASGVTVAKFAALVIAIVILAAFWLASFKQRRTSVK